MDDATLLDLAARSPVNVMVTASDHAGRTRWARAIHDRSARRDGPFVAAYGDSRAGVNGVEDVDDWFERAAGGTLFIDDVAHWGARAQDRLLRLLTEQSRHAGENETLAAGRLVRVIAGCNRSLLADLAAGAFNDALFYRLNVIHIDRIDQEHPGSAAFR